MMPLARSMVWAWHSSSHPTTCRATRRAPHPPTRARRRARKETTHDGICGESAGSSGHATATGATASQAEAAVVQSRLHAALERAGDLFHGYAGVHGGVAVPRLARDDRVAG